MSTTIVIADDLALRVAQLADAEGRTLGEFVEEVLRRSVGEHRHVTHDGFVTVGGGLQPGIDPADRARLLDISMS